MQEQENITTVEEAPSSTTAAANTRSDWKAFVDKLSYNGIVNNIGFLTLLFVLALTYIYSNQEMIAVQRELNKQNKILKELRWKYMDVKSRMLNAGMETEIIRNATKIGMKPMMFPAYKVTIDTNKQHPTKK